METGLRVRGPQEPGRAEAEGSSGKRAFGSAEREAGKPRNGRVQEASGAFLGARCRTPRPGTWRLHPFWAPETPTSETARRSCPGIRAGKRPAASPRRAFPSGHFEPASLHLAGVCMAAAKPCVNDIWVLDRADTQYLEPVRFRLNRTVVKTEPSPSCPDLFRASTSCGIAVRTGDKRAGGPTWMPGTSPISANLLWIEVGGALRSAASGRFGEGFCDVVPLVDRAGEAELRLDGPADLVEDEAELAPRAMGSAAAPGRIPRGKRRGRGRPACRRAAPPGVSRRARRGRCRRRAWAGGPGGPAT